MAFKASGRSHLLDTGVSVNRLRGRNLSTPQEQRAGQVAAARPAWREASRPRGRPPKSAAEHGLVLRALLNATRAVFARGGYRGLSVELVLAEAGPLPRPTFYRYFRSMDDATGDGVS